MGVIANAVIATVFLKEPFRKRDLVGAVRPSPGHITCPRHLWARACTPFCARPSAAQVGVCTVCLGVILVVAFAPKQDSVLDADRFYFLIGQV